MSGSSKGTALVTGASSGIGAVYADRLAKRGYDLILVARDKARLDVIAERLTREDGVKVDVLKTDLTDPDQVKRVEDRLQTDTSITLLVNNAGIGAMGGFAGGDINQLGDLLAVNVTAVARLAAAAIPGMLKRGGGAIINIASVVGYVPEMLPGAYGATKAFVIALSKSLQSELESQGVYVQAVLPAATATEIWERTGASIDHMPKGSVMTAEDLVDAALVGFDRKEPISLPSLPDDGQYQAFEAARGAMAQNFGNGTPAARYR